MTQTFKLTELEMMAVNLTAVGCKMKETAARLGVSVWDVDCALRRAKTALRARTLAHAAVIFTTNSVEIIEERKRGRAAQPEESE